MKRTPIKKISYKRKKRLLLYSEKDLFMTVWNNRLHNCAICSASIREPQSRCFAHILPKGTYPKYRLYDNNILLVCSIECHAEVDRRVA